MGERDVKIGSVLKPITRPRLCTPTPVGVSPVFVGAFYPRSSSRLTQMGNHGLCPRPSTMCVGQLTLPNRILVPCVALCILAVSQTRTVAGDGARGAEKEISGRRAESPICLSANNLSIATGQPSLVNMSSGSTHIPVWSLSGGTVGQSVAGLVAGLPGWVRGGEGRDRRDHDGCGHEPRV